VVILTVEAQAKESARREGQTKDPTVCCLAQNHLLLRLFS